MRGFHGGFGRGRGQGVILQRVRFATLQLHRGKVVRPKFASHLGRAVGSDDVAFAPQISAVHRLLAPALLDLRYARQRCARAGRLVTTCGERAGRKRPRVSVHRAGWS